MASVKHVFPGGNTCYGFYSFYDYITSPSVKRKYILKGGPGVGKSVFMTKMGDEFFQRGFNVEYHWCSSDPNSVDGLVIGDNEVCFLDGTSPHVVEPKYPGAVDEIIDLGRFWEPSLIAENKDNIIKLTELISLNFARAYLRLKESNIAYTELKTYYEEAVDIEAVKRNIVALADDFISNCSSEGKTRHLFPGAISPAGLVTKIGSVIGKNTTLFAVTGSPGTGIKDLFSHVAQLININSISAQIYHNPFNPEEIDIIFIPAKQVALVDYANFFFTYSSEISSSKYKRQLDFDKFLAEDKLSLNAKNINAAQNRIEEGLKDAVAFISKAKKLHDQLESCYVPAMNFDAVELYRQEIVTEVASLL